MRRWLQMRPYFLWQASCYQKNVTQILFCFQRNIYEKHLRVGTVLLGVRHSQTPTEHHKDLKLSELLDVGQCKLYAALDLSVSDVCRADAVQAAAHLFIHNKTEKNAWEPIKLILTHFFLNINRISVRFVNTQGTWSPFLRRSSCQRWSCWCSSCVQSWSQTCCHWLSMKKTKQQTNKMRMWFHL